MQLEVSGGSAGTFAFEGSVSVVFNEALAMPVGLLEGVFSQLRIGKELGNVCGVVDRDLRERCDCWMSSSGGGRFDCRGWAKGLKKSVMFEVLYSGIL